MIPILEEPYEINVEYGALRCRWCNRYCGWARVTPAYDDGSPVYSVRCRLCYETWHDLRQREYRKIFGGRDANR